MALRIMNDPIQMPGENSYAIVRDVSLVQDSYGPPVAKVNLQISNPESMDAIDAFLRREPIIIDPYEHPEKAIRICEHCGQWAAMFTACRHCGAPVPTKEER